LAGGRYTQRQRDGFLKRPAIITTPYPTLDEVARMYGITKKRQKELDKLVEEIHATMKAEDAAKNNTAKGNSNKKRPNPPKTATGKK
jgi:hypothetical protein